MNSVSCVGGGTSASPTFTTCFPGDSTYLWKALVDNAAPYGWWACGILTSGSTPASSFVWDPLEATHPSDNFKYVFYGSGYSNNAIGTLNLDYGLSDGAVTGGREFIVTRLPSSGTGTALQEGMLKLMNIGNQNIINFNSSTTTGVNSHPISGKDSVLPVFYGRTNFVSSSHFKGVSTFLRFKTQNRSTGAVLEFGTGNYAVVLRDFILPWDKSTFSL